MNDLKRDPGSFRDPSGYVLHYRGQILRSLDRISFGLAGELPGNPAYRLLAAQRRLLATEIPDEAAQTHFRELEGVPDRNYLVQKKLWFISYPYEWSPKMLFDAARCTLEVESTLLDQGYNLKDASVYNVQFETSEGGPAPPLVDTTSIERLGNASFWFAYSQFLRHFLLPLLLYEKKGLDFRGVYLADLEGIDPELAHSLAGRLQRLLPPYFFYLTLPRWLAKWEGNHVLAKDESESVSNDSDCGERSRYVVGAIVKSLMKRLRRLEPGETTSRWSQYGSMGHYTNEAAAQKESFLRLVCEKEAPRTVLDIGSNVGQFSLIAARAGARVLAVDSDVASIDRLYRSAQDEKLAVPPLRVDLAAPSPGIGWKNSERASFFDRVEPFDCVFALAVVHHLLITNRVPLDEIVGLFHKLSNQLLVVELVGPEDAMFTRLARRAFGSGVELIRTSRKGVVNYGAIPELEGVDLDRYRKQPLEVVKINILPSSES